jgi:hypothetical protein
LSEKVQKRSRLEGVDRVRREKAPEVRKPRRVKAPALVHKTNVGSQLFKGNKALEPKQPLLVRAEGGSQTAGEQQASRGVRLFEGKKTLKGESQERLSLK